MLIQAHTVNTLIDPKQEKKKYKLTISENNWETEPNKTRIKFKYMWITFVYEIK